MLAIIVAVSDNHVIGSNNTLLWHLREDLLRFKQITMGHTIVMGRKTFESIGKVLPGRQHIILSRDPNYTQAGCTVYHNLETALASCSHQKTFIIGGAEIYQQSLALVQSIYLTRIYHPYQGDAFFPELDDTWVEVSKESFARGEQFQYPYAFIEYRKK